MKRIIKSEKANGEIIKWKFNNPSLYLTTPENSFMNRNKLVEINPYSMKKMELL